MKIKILKNGADYPEYKTEGAAGADIYASTPKDILIPPGQTAIVPTGLYMEIEKGYEVQIRPRSGLAAKNGITVLNTPGTIDSDYTGEVKVILINTGSEDFYVHDGDRIAQMVAAPVIRAEFEFVSALTETERGDGGFGSTGRN